MSWPGSRAHSASSSFKPPSLPGSTVLDKAAALRPQVVRHPSQTSSNTPNRSELPQPPLPSRPCEVCQKSNLKTYYCVNCDGSFCDSCWDDERPHRTGKRGPDGLPHEKADSIVVNRLKETFTPPSDPKVQERMHIEDEDTTWFGIARDVMNMPIFQDYGRYATLMAQSATGESIRYPQLVSFIGQTGAGKSTLVKMLIEQQRAKTNPPSNILFPTPIVGSINNDNVPISGDVHLYADPATYFGHCPMLYADCEGLEGGENTPIGIRHRELGDGVASRKQKDAHGESFRLSKRRWTIARGGQRDIAWATSPEKQKRQYAVTELYPRLLYTFSDVIVFVLQNPKVFESAVLSKLLGWASSSMEKSLNQPNLPHAIIALNATDLGVDEREWDCDYATDKLLSTVAGSINRDAKYREYADFWTGRGRHIRTMKDLLLCYYSSVRVVRIPKKGRYMLIDDQVSKLHQEITQSCDQSYYTKRRARMLSNSDELHVYLQCAFDHFSQNLERPFNFIEVAFKNNPIPLDFGGNILKLAVAIKDRGQFEGGRKIFRQLATMVASCINLDCVRHGLRGSADILLEKYYMEYCDYALQDFCALFWPCEYNSKRGRCVNVQEGHTKGHQNERGTVIGTGGFESEFTWESYEEEWLHLLQHKVHNIQSQIQEKLQDRTLNEGKLAPEMHQRTMQDFYRRLGGARLFNSHSTCFCCLRECPEHPLPCGHVLCMPCIADYGTPIRGNMIQIESCPLHPFENFTSPWYIKYKPEMAGVRILTLDGGGIRGIVELEVLNEIERYLGGKIPIQSFFDLIVGTSTGGIIALGLGVQGWRVQECINKFIRLVDKAFTPRLPGIVGAFGTKYKTAPIEKALQDAFSDELLFGGPHDDSSSYYAKVAVTATTETGLYGFVRPDLPGNEMKLWEVARATSAAPTFFKPFVNDRTKEGYVDGAVYNNNPAQIAFQESKLLFPDVEHCQPDIFLSLGTGHNGKNTTGYAENRNRISRHKPFANEDPNSVRSETEQRGRFHWLRSIPFLANITVMANRLDNILSSEQQWHEFRNWVLDSNATEGRRYLRLNPKLGYRPPRLDEKHQIESLRSTVKENLRRPEYRSRISQVAHRLIASCFYFEKSKKPMEAEQQNNVKGKIRCRFQTGSNELRELGTFLNRHQTPSFQPFFRIQEKHREYAAVNRVITPDTIQRMITMAQFTMNPIDIHVSEKNGATTIALGLQDEVDQREEVIPISGFPRVLIMDEAKKASIMENSSSEHKKTVKRRNTKRSQRNISSGSGLDEISKMQAIIELSVPEQQRYPENVDDVSDWVTRRAARRLDSRPITFPSLPHDNSSSSSRATSPSGVLHSDVIELPANDFTPPVARLQDEVDEVDEDDLALRAAIALSLQDLEQSTTHGADETLDSGVLNEVLQRSKFEK